jgi:hypothetical protein
MRAAQRVRAHLAQAPVQHLALRHQVLDGARDVLDRHLRVDAVLVQQVDAVGAQPLEHAVDGQLDVLRTAVQARAALAGLRSMFQPNFEVIATLLRNGATPSPRMRSTSCGP